jgi:hypothetical protein
LFRSLQKRLFPGLDCEQFQTLYAEWQDRYAAKCEQARIRARDRILRYAQKQAKRNAPSPPFKCVCGAETKEPLDPAWVATHSHIFKRQARNASRANSVSAARGRADA